MRERGGVRDASKEGFRRGAGALSGRAGRIWIRKGKERKTKTSTNQQQHQHHQPQHHHRQNTSPPGKRRYDSPFSSPFSLVLFFSRLVSRVLSAFCDFSFRGPVSNSTVLSPFILSFWSPLQTLGGKGRRRRRCLRVSTRTALLCG